MELWNQSHLLSLGKEKESIPDPSRPSPGQRDSGMNRAFSPLGALLEFSLPGNLVKQEKPASSIPAPR